jgi:alpha-L-rhamnosidase
MKGQGRETWEPRFTLHGFRFVEVSGFPGIPARENLLGCVVHTACASAGTFECDNELINRIHRATRWSQRSNLMGYPMDCPQRDERLGWFGDAMVTAEEAMFNFDLPVFYRQWLDGIRLNQNQTNGDISIISPRPYMTDEPDPTWSSAYPVTVWQYYRHYGDRRFLERQFDAMARYVDFLGTQATKHILPKYWIGDWGTITEGWKEGEPVSVATAFYYYDALIVSRAARVLGRLSEAAKYADLANQIKAAYNRTYYDPGKQQYEQGSQFSNAFPLWLGLAEPAEQPVILQRILNDLERRRGHFDVGVLGAKYLIDALTLFGRSDVAFGLAIKTGYPSWAHLLEGGRTTLSEFWDLHGSHNHVMLGSIDAWFYRTLAGIQSDDGQHGFAHIQIRPFIPDSLSWVRAGVQTVRGRVVVEWEKRKGALELRVAIPANTTATVHVPGGHARSVSTTPRLTPARADPGATVYEIGSGNYTFTANALPIRAGVNR